MIDTISVPVAKDTDIVTARQHGRAIALELGFSPGNAALVATAISELARNILLYAGEGAIDLEVLVAANRCGVQVVARDNGPGIPDLQQALQDGFSTSRRLGLGLPGVRRLMDEFRIETRVGCGTTVIARKWAR